MDMSERRKRILGAVITEYVMTAEPVGSRTISKRYEIDLSPATIRNIMSDLEDMGYFSQPHTSSGRVPTEKAFRFYIEELVQYHEVDPQTQANLRSRTEGSESDMRALVSQSSKLLSELTRYPGLGFIPALSSTSFRHIRFIKLQTCQVLVVLVTNTGLIQNRFVNVERDLQQRDLDEMSAYLNSLLGGLSLSECRERLVEERNQAQAQYDALLQQAVQFGECILHETDQQVFIEGGSNILHAPEFGDLNRIRSLFQAFEEKNTILEILDRALTSPGVHVYMGENENKSLENCAVVAATYGAGGAPWGAVGVIGPMRMDYATVVPLVEYTSQLISKHLESLKGD